MFQDITVSELLKLQQDKQLLPIDVRSPSEFADASIPGSVNIPLFDDAERAEIGTIYKQISIDAAKERGLEIVSAKLPAFIRAFATYPGPKALFCWRGGMRSRTSVTLLSLMGIKAYRLTGGFRAYRRWVVEILEQLALPGPAYIINGNTGSGKTLLLRRLQQEGYPVLDLEQMAGHRGSIFGQIGLRANNQKTFESELVSRLGQLREAPYVLIEGESRRIGKVVLPEFIVAGKETGTQFFLNMPVEQRVQHILDDYQPWLHQEEVLLAFRHIRNRIHTPIGKEIETHLIEQRYEQAIQLLLEHYYDPRYEHAIQEYTGERIIVNVNTVDEAIEAVKRHLASIASLGNEKVQS